MIIRFCKYTSIKENKQYLKKDFNFTEFFMQWEQILLNTIATKIIHD